MPIFSTGNIGIKVNVTIHANMKVNLAVQHMMAAARFSREVDALEQRHRGEEFGAFWEISFNLRQLVCLPQ
jgi:hypothetical protein